MVHNRHIKSSRDCSLFFISTNVQLAVGSSVGKTMNEPWIAMKRKNYLLVFCEYIVIVHVTQVHEDAQGSAADRIRSTTLTTRIFNPGKMLHGVLKQRLDDSSAGTSPALAITTSGSPSWSLLAQSQTPIPLVQCTTACSMVKPLITIVLTANRQIDIVLTPSNNGP
jgi:hypothetical protein